MFKIIPSVEISQGKIVRSLHGDIHNLKNYAYSPVDVAKMLEDIGIEVIHFVDIDGLEKESPVNYHVLEVMSGYTDIKIDYAGGIRTDGDINKVFEYGATYFTVGSVAVSNPDLMSSWIISYGREKISMSADAVDKMISIKGWRKQTDIDLMEHIEFYYNKGLKYLKVTDIARDGLLEGPNFELYEEVLTKFPDIKLAASGGVRSVDDIKRLRDSGCYAVIIGRALYEKKIEINDLKQFIP